MSTGGRQDGIKVRTLQAVSGRGGPQRRLKVGAAIVVLGVILMLVSSFWLGLIIAGLGVVVTGAIKRTRH